MTSQAILSAVLDGTMQAQTALDLGLIAVEGEQREAEVTRRALAEITNHARIGVVVGSPVVPTRLFGPAR